MFSLMLRSPRRLSRRIWQVAVLLAMGCALAAPLAHGYAQGGSGVHVPPPDGPWTVYLTFDDGPSSSVTPQILRHPGGIQRQSDVLHARQPHRRE